jgi:hypothetical protein
MFALLAEGGYGKEDKTKKDEARFHIIWYG